MQGGTLKKILDGHITDYLTDKYQKHTILGLTPSHST